MVSLVFQPWWLPGSMLIYQRVNLHFPMVFLWFSYGFPMVFLCYIPWFTRGYPMFDRYKATVPVPVSYRHALAMPPLPVPVPVPTCRATSWEIFRETWTGRGRWKSCWKPYLIMNSNIYTYIYIYIYIYTYIYIYIHVIVIIMVV